MRARVVVVLEFHATTKFSALPVSPRPVGACPSLGLAAGVPGYARYPQDVAMLYNVSGWSAGKPGKAAGKAAARTTKER